MIVVPAIDIVQGEVVRLAQGKFEKKTVYGQDPAETARSFVQAGASRIHVVDLEGAREGRPRERSLIERLLQEISAEFQVGGGIRDAEEVNRYLGSGAKRVVLGTRASLDRGFLKEILGAFPGSVIVAIDAVEGKCATHGWTRVTDVSVEHMVAEVESLGGTEILYTDIPQDGMLRGVDTASLRRVVELSDLKVLASGGVSQLKDIEALMELKLSRLIGVIVGRALYEGNFSLKEAVQLTARGMEK